MNPTKRRQKLITELVKAMLANPQIVNLNTNPVDLNRVLNNAILLADRILNNVE